MLQIIIPRKKVDALAYLSLAFGVPYHEKIAQSFNVTKSRHTDISSILDVYRNNPFSINTAAGKKYLEHVRDEIDLYTHELHDKTVKDEYLARQFIHFASPIKTANVATIDELQARIILLPQFFDPESGIKIFSFTLTPEKDLENYRRELRMVINRMLADWLKQPETQAQLKDLNVPLAKLMTRIMSGELQKDVKEAFDEVHGIYVQLRRPKF